MHPLQDVSVVIPTRDRAGLLLRAVESVVRQTQQPAEIIVVDDGSSDGTGDLLASSHPRVRCFRQPPRGVSAARNRGVAASSGRWIAFLDSDDEWLPQKLERQLAALHRDPTQVVCHTNELWIRRGRRVNQQRKHAKSGGGIFQRCLPLCVVSPSSVLIRREILEEVGGFDESMPVCEDYDLWLRVCSRYPVVFVDEPLVIKHGGHDDQLSARYWGMDRYRIHALEKVLRAETLGAEDREAAIRELLSKLEIYIAGARKHGRRADVAVYEAKRERWTALETPAQ